MSAPARVRWHRVATADVVAREAAARIAAHARRAIAARGRFRVVLAGGRTPEHAYRLLARERLMWWAWQVYFGDERCLPRTHTERNSVMVARALTEQVPIARDALHPIRAELGASAAAPAYARSLSAAQPFDLVLLGLGEDGHTASLFPGRARLRGDGVLAVQRAPKPPPARVSLAPHVLANARAVLVLVTGVGKRDAVRAWRAGADLPIARVRPAHGLDVLIDQDAD